MPPHRERHESKTPRSRRRMVRTVTPQRFLRASLGVSLVTLMPMVAHAAAPEVEQAEKLFGEGQSLMASSQFAEACVKFAASQRLDPGIGTLLRLGDCFEKSGRSTSAFRAFQEAA